MLSSRDSRGVAGMGVEGGCVDGGRWVETSPRCRESDIGAVGSPCPQSRMEKRSCPRVLMVVTHRKLSADPYMDMLHN